MFGGTYFGRSYFGGRYFGDGGTATQADFADLRPALRAYLLADDDIEDALGGDHIYPITLPQGRRAPTIVYTRIPGPWSDYKMEGHSGFAKTWVRIDCFATDRDTAFALAAKVKARINGFAGVVSYGDPVETLTIQGIFIRRSENQFDDRNRMHVRSVEYEVVWEEQ